MQDRPDQDAPLRHAINKIQNSRLGRKALLFSDYQEFKLFLNDLMNIIHTLSLSCHLPEFTNHGLEHLISIVNRISEWSGTAKSTSQFICETLSTEDAAALLIAVLIHDIGMLSQKDEDLEKPVADPKYSVNVGTPDWVRITHIPRMKNLVIRLFKDRTDYQALLLSPFMTRVFKIAKAHGSWPEDQEFKELPPHDKGLAAVLAVSDLLDEDSSRCDTETLINHRDYTQQNLGHWIRHTLTLEKVQIHFSKVVVKLGHLPNTDSSMEPVYCALRNQYRLVQLYGDALGNIGVARISPEFHPGGFPKEQVDQLSDWTAIPMIPDLESLIYILLLSFMPEATLDATKVPSDFIKKAKALDFELVDLTYLYSPVHPGVITSDVENEFYNLVS